MTTAHTPTDGESKEFTTASEYFEGDDEPDHEGPHYAKGIVWYDQARPIFVCCLCHEEMERFRWDGHRKVPDYDEKRAEAYRRLVEDSPPCDVCANTIPEGVL